MTLFHVKQEHYFPVVTSIFPTNALQARSWDLP